MTCVITTPPSTLRQAVTLTYTLLQRFALSPDFISSLEAVFGHDLNTAFVFDLGQAWRKGDFHDLPNIEICPAAEIDEAMGIFVRATKTIYMSQEFLTLFANDPEIVAVVLLEEIGEYLSANIHSSDTPESQAIFFADLVQGHSLQQSFFTADPLTLVVR